MKKLILALVFPVSFIFADEQKVVAVFDLEAVGGVSEVAVQALSDRFRQELLGTQRMIVIDRQKMDLILREQGLQLSECTEEECAIEMGRLLNAEKSLVGKISKVGQRYILQVEMLDLVSGRIDFSKSHEVAVAEERLSDFIPGLAQDVVAEFPLEGKVVRVQDQGVTVDVGYEDGVRVGMIFGVFRRGEAIIEPSTEDTIGFEEARVGELEVVSVQPRVSTARKLRKKDIIDPGDWVQAVEMMGELQVNARPENAAVYLDKVYLGSGHVYQKGVKIGKHSLLVTLAPDWDDDERRVKIRRNKVTKVKVSLKRSESWKRAQQREKKRRVVGYWTGTGLGVNIIRTEETTGKPAFFLDEFFNARPQLLFTEPSGFEATLRVYSPKTIFELGGYLFSNLGRRARYSKELDESTGLPKKGKLLSTERLYGLFADLSYYRTLFTLVAFSLGAGYDYGRVDFSVKETSNDSEKYENHGPLFTAGVDFKVFPKWIINLKYRQTFLAQDYNRRDFSLGIIRNFD